jgi:ribosomal protein L12E/L44/L45/RPP1/RPP2
VLKSSASLCRAARTLRGSVDPGKKKKKKKKKKEEEEEEEEEEKEEKKKKKKPLFSLTSFRSLIYVGNKVLFVL